jgi:uncharacterized membrane protein
MITVYAAAEAVRAFIGAAPSPSPSPTPVINTNGIMGAITKYVVPLLLAALGVVFISRAGKGEMSRVLTSSAIALIGLGFIAGAGLLLAFGGRLADLIFPAGPR